MPDGKTSEFFPKTIPSNLQITVGNDSQFDSLISQLYHEKQKLTSTLFVSGKKVQPLVYYCTPTHPKLDIYIYINIYIYICRERYRHDSLEHVCPFKHGNFGYLPSLKLTVSTWKWMVGIRSFPFAMAYFLGYVSFREGKFRLCITQVKWAMKKIWLFRVYRGRDNTTQLHGDHFANNYKDPMKQPVHPGRLRAGTYKSFGKENDVPNLYDCGPAVSLQGCIFFWIVWNIGIRKSVASSCFHIETTIKQPGFNGK